MVWSPHGFKPAEYPVIMATKELMIATRECSRCGLVQKIGRVCRNCNSTLHPAYYPTMARGHRGDLTSFLRFMFWPYFEITDRAFADIGYALFCVHGLVTSLFIIIGGRGFATLWEAHLGAQLDALWKILVAIFLFSLFFIPIVVFPGGGAWGWAIILSTKQVFVLWVFGFSLICVYFLTVDSSLRFIVYGLGVSYGLLSVSFSIRWFLFARKGTVG